MRELQCFEEDYDDVYQNKGDVHDGYLRDEYPELYTMDRENPEGDNSSLIEDEIGLAVESGFDYSDSGNW